MKIVYDVPPLFDAIDAAFGVAGKPILFAWGDTIYNPGRVDIPAPLMAHEAVHGRNQLAMGVEDWWWRYIDEPRFRLSEELDAHAAEYLERAKGANRGQRRAYLKQTAKRLAMPLYGGLVNTRTAQKLIEDMCEGIAV